MWGNVSDMQLVIRVPCSLHPQTGEPLRPFINLPDGLTVLRETVAEDDDDCARGWLSLWVDAPAHLCQVAHGGYLLGNGLFAVAAEP